MEINGASGINSAINTFNMAATKIARSQGSLAGNSVELINAETQLGANVNVIKTQNDMLGTIIDLKA